jgi:hypothetical protein
MGDDTAAADSRMQVGNPIYRGFLIEAVVFFPFEKEFLGTNAICLRITGRS